MEFISYGIAYNRSNYVFIHRNGSIQTDMLCQLSLSIWNILCFFLPSYHSFHACVWVSSGLSAWLCVVQFDQYSQAYTTHTKRDIDVGTISTLLLMWFYSYLCSSRLSHRFTYLMMYVHSRLLLLFVIYFNGFLFQANQVDMTRKLIVLFQLMYSNDDKVQRGISQRGTWWLLHQPKKNSIDDIDKKKRINAIFFIYTAENVD